MDIKNPNVFEVENSYSSKVLLNMLHESFKKSDELLGKLKQELGND